MKKNIDQVEKQIQEQQQIIDFDTREFTIEYIVDKYLKGIDEDKNDKIGRAHVWTPVTS